MKKTCRLVIPGRYRETFENALRQLLLEHEGNTQSKTFEMVGLRKNGTEIPVEVSLSKWRAGKKIFFTVIIRDITRRKRAEEALTRSRDFYLLLFDEFPALIWRSGPHSELIYFNKAWLDFRGRTLEQEIDSWTKGIHPEDRDHFLKTYEEAFRARLPFETEFRLLHETGEYRWFNTCGRPFGDLDKNFGGFIGVCHDITERKEQAEQLVYLATHDPLTGLPNRRSLEEVLKRAVPRARRGYKSALVFLDMDNFSESVQHHRRKRICRGCRHVSGDRVLVLLSQLLQRQLRAGDLMVRLGGDEFAVLLEGISIEEAQAVAERMRRAVSEFTFRVKRRTFNLTVSIGTVPIDGNQSPTAVLSQADVAMYKAKEQGRNKVVLHSYKKDARGADDMQYSFPWVCGP